MTYDVIGIGYDSTRRPDRRIAERIRALLEPRACGHYLDAACGTGNYTSSLHALGLDVVGIDQSKTMLEAARAKYPAMTWQQAEVTGLPFPDGHFVPRCNPACIASASTVKGAAARLRATRCRASRLRPGRATSTASEASCR